MRPHSLPISVPTLLRGLAGIVGLVGFITVCLGTATAVSQDRTPDGALPVDQGATTTPLSDERARGSRPTPPRTTSPTSHLQVGGLAQPVTPPGTPGTAPAGGGPAQTVAGQPTTAPGAGTPTSGTAAAAAQHGRGEPPFGFVPGRPAPILVVPLADARVAPATVQAITDAAAAALSPMSHGHPVQPVSDPARLASIAACRDATCLGAQIAEAGGIAGVMIRISRARPRTPIDLTIGVVDPVSGAPRREPVTGQIPAAAEASPGEHVTPLVAQLVDAMPSAAPPPATLLVTVNVDGAMVRIDNFEAGRSPLASLTIRPGRYPVLVNADGYHLTRQMVSVTDGEQARLDVTLEPDQAAQALLAQQEEQSHPSDGPIYTRWWFLAGAGAVVLGATIAIILVATSGGDAQNPPGFPVPPIR